MSSHHRSRFFAVLVGAAALAVTPLATATPDTDGDGVIDTLDAFPADATASSALYVPGVATQGLLLLEDQWPAKGDYDYNDAVVSYHYAFALNASGKVSKIVLTFNALAAGGGRASGLGLTLPGISATGVTMTLDSGGVTTPVANRTNETDVAVTLAPNLFSLFTPPAPWISPSMVNSKPGQPVLASPPRRLTITFPAGGVTVDTAKAPFDLFYFRTPTAPSTDVSWETHLPQYAGTHSMNNALFNTAYDASTATNHFVGKNGMPYVLDVPASVGWPKEGTLVTTAYPAFGVSNNPPWWTTPAAGAVYTGGTTGPSPTPAFVGGATSGAITGAASCVDQIQNQGESAVDCGGPICAKCDLGKSCVVAGDCQSNTCTGGVCQAAPVGTCSDGILNQNEVVTDQCGVCGIEQTLFSDAGYWISTPLVAQQFSWFVSAASGGLRSHVAPSFNTESLNLQGKAAGYYSVTMLFGDGSLRNSTEIYWDGASRTPILTGATACAVAGMSCVDNILNQGETGVDCGGPCAPCGLCTDGILNQNEVAIDQCGVCGIQQTLFAYNDLSDPGLPYRIWAPLLAQHRSWYVSATSGGAPSPVPASFDTDLLNLQGRSAGYYRATMLIKGSLRNTTEIYWDGTSMRTPILTAATACASP